MSNQSPEDLMREAAAHYGQGRVEQTASLCQRVLSIQPNNVNALHLYGMLLTRTGQMEAAIELLKRAADLAPAVAMIQHNYGQTLRLAGRYDEAVDAYGKAARIDRNHFKAHFGVGLSLQMAKRHREALDPLRIAIRIAPDFVHSWITLGVSLAALHEYPEAIQAFRRVVQLTPNDAPAQYNLGKAYQDTGDFERAAEHFRRAIAIDPNQEGSHLNLANVLGESGFIQEAIQLQRRASELAPSKPGNASNILLSLHYLPNVSPEEVLAEHKRWGERFGHATTKIELRNDRSPDRRLRVGYLSPDYHRHPVASFLESVLAGHDRTKVELIAYSNCRRQDAITRRLQGMVDRWRDIFPLDDDAASKLIVDDQTDILVDLAGHTGDNRAPLMARGAAPVQFTYLGYPATTGVPAIQYRLTDALADPPGMTEGHHTEQLVRLPDCFLCFTPDEDAPPPLAVSTAQTNGYVTFGSFNNFAKVTNEMLEVWARIVASVPNSRMIFKARALSLPRAQQRVIDIFAKHGVAKDRLTLTGWTPYNQRHAFVASADIALDSFPYHGTTTTCETLWQGVPWITLEGCTHVSRVGVSILTNVKVPELIAKDLDQYSRLALELANDLPRLNRYRTTLREKLQTSPLLDRKRFCANLEAAYRDAWRAWCAS